MTQRKGQKEAAILERVENAKIEEKYPIQVDCAAP
jgi:hypothetical protein